MGVFGEFGVLNAWYLQNKEKPLPTELVIGQFPAQDVSEKIANKWAVHGALNRQNPIVQFISGDADILSFKAKLYARDITDQKPKMSLSKLKEWAKMDPVKKRPPVLTFWIGDKHLQFASCFIQSLSIDYSIPTKFGKLREVNFTMELVKYEPYKLAQVKIAETRYHRAHIRDYYEMLCYREYGNPMLGDAIRKRHPNQPTLPLAAVVKLPSVEAIRKEIIEPKSVVLKTAFGNKVTNQRMAVIDMLDKRNREYVSHV